MSDERKSALGYNPLAWMNNSVTLNENQQRSDVGDEQEKPMLNTELLRGTFAALEPNGGHDRTVLPGIV